MREKTGWVCPFVWLMLNRWHAYATISKAIIKFKLKENVAVL